MAARVGKKVRFEVFKRDGFKCQYCGRSAPDVVLHVDHINPKSRGGKNDLVNLITSCADCNLGKGARPLDDASTVDKQRRQLQELNERRLQLQMMVEWREELSRLEDDKVSSLRSEFEKRANATVNAHGVRELQKLVRQYPFDMIYEAIEVACTEKLDGSSRKPDEAIGEAFQYIRRVCNARQALKDEPYLQDLWSIRSTARNRCGYFNNPLALRLLKEAYACGATVESLRQFAREIRSWSRFSGGLQEFIDQHSQGSGL